MRLHRRQPRRGLSTVELALVMPLLFGILFGIIEFGWFFFVSHTIQGAAREGARAGAVAGGTKDDVEDAVRGAMSAAGFGKKSYKVKIEDPGGGSIDPKKAEGGEPVMVRVEVPWKDVRPGVSFVSWFTGATVFPSNVSGETVMRKEG